MILAFALSSAAQDMCPPRPSPGSQVMNPLNLYSENGTLSLDLALRSEIGPTGYTHYCYVYMNNGTPVINPCDGSPVFQGQIFDPSTTRTVTVGGQQVKCRTAFPAGETEVRHEVHCLHPLSSQSDVPSGSAASPAAASTKQQENR